MARIGRLQVLEVVAEGEVQSSRAVDTTDGSRLILHTGGLSLLDVADTLGADVLERGETGGKIYILTPDRPELQNLNGPRTAPPPTKEPGEFTRMFQIPNVAKAAPAAPVSPAFKSDADTPGEFTRMFRAVPAELPKAAPPAPLAPPAAAAYSEPVASSPGASAPGESAPGESAPGESAPASGGSDFGFTGMFSAVSRISVESEPSPKQPPIVVPPDLPAPKQEAAPSTPSPAADSGPGEFTSFFRAPAARPAAPSASAAPSPPASAAPVRPAPSAPQPKPESADSEFTRMFQASPPASRGATPPAHASAPAPPPPQSEQEQPQRARPMDGEFTRMFNAQPASIPNAPPQLTYPVRSSPSSAPSSIPEDDAGMFTRQFQAPARPASTPPSAPLPLPVKPAASSDSGEFTRFFKDPLPVGREPDWKAIEKQAPPPPSAKPEGDFTKMFGRPGGGAAPPQAAGRAGASDLFQAQRPAATSAPPASAKPTAPAAGAPAGGDEYGKMFAPKPDVGQSLKAPPKLAAIPVEAPVKKPPVILLVIIIVALLVIAGAALYHFVLKPK